MKRTFHRLSLPAVIALASLAQVLISCGSPDPAVTPQAEATEPPAMPAPKETAVSPQETETPPQPAAAPAPQVATEQGLVPFDPRWDWPNYLGFRPANQAAVELNPPRMSWPYNPDVLSNWGESSPAREFVLQIAQRPTFDNPAVERRSAWNFDNALAPLPAGTWYWRVGYAVPGGPVDRWSEARTFTITESTLRWDRTVLDDPVPAIVKKHPRLGPADGDWAALRQRIEGDPSLRPIWDRMVADGEKLLASQVWQQGFPASDRKVPGMSKRKGSKWFRDLGDELGTAVFLYKVAGDERYKPALDMMLQAAALPQGGETSPEFNGASDKWGTRWTYLLARTYDWCYDELTPAQRELLLNAVAWRIRAVLGTAASWRTKNGGVHAQSIAVFTQSHPFENFNHAVKALMLVAGDGSDVDEYVRPALNYLVGVTGSHGPDEAWNEAGSYVFFKSLGALDAAGTVAMTLPSLQVERSPWYPRLAHFLVDFAWPGLKRQGFGEYTLDMSSGKTQGELRRCLQWVAVISKDPVSRKVWGEIDRRYPHNDLLPSPAWLIVADRLGVAQPGGELPATRFYGEAGWVFAGSFDPSDPAAAQQGVRVAVMSRPRGGYSHSYAHDGAYVWYAYDQTLTDGGASTSYGDPLARHGMSHNGILVEGRSPALRGFEGAYPYSARPLYWQQDGDMAAWSVDLTGSFLSEPGKGDGGYNYAKKCPGEWGYADLDHWRRHFLFVRGRYLAVYDEVGVRAGTPPARFTWSHHFPVGAAAQEPQADETQRRLDYQVGPVRAQVVQRTSTPANARLLKGADIMVNPVTELDFGPIIEAAYAKREKAVRTWELWGDQVWRVQTPPVRRASFLTVLVPTPEGQTPPAVELTGDATATITDGGESFTLSFASGGGADYQLDAAMVDAFAAHTDPFRLPTQGEPATLALGETMVSATWLRQDDFQDAAWVNRWNEHGTADVYAAADGLHVNATDGTSALSLTAELPERAVLLLEPAAVSGTGEAAIVVGEVRVSLGLRAGDSEARLVVIGDGHLRVYAAGRLLHDTALPAIEASRPTLETIGLAVVWKVARLGRIEGSLP